MDDGYLVTGLIGMANAPSFNEMHFGAAVLAAYFLVHDNDVDFDDAEAVSRAVCQHVDKMILCRPYFDPPSSCLEVCDVERAKAQIMNALEDTIDKLVVLGHNVIFASLALRAVQTLEDKKLHIVSAGVISAISTLLGSCAASSVGEPFFGWDDPNQVKLVAEEDGCPYYATEDELVTETLLDFPRVQQMYKGFHQGVVGHKLDLAQAILDLQKLGYSATARRAHPVLKLYLKLARRRATKSDNTFGVAYGIPSEVDPSSVEQGVLFEPFLLQFWQQDLRGTDDWLFGHVFKYTYAYLGLTKQLQLHSQWRLKDRAAVIDLCKQQMVYLLAPSIPGFHVQQQPS